MYEKKIRIQQENSYKINFPATQLYCTLSTYVTSKTISHHNQKKGLTICTLIEIVCLPVLFFTYSHVENALFFDLDLVGFLQLELLFQTYQLVYRIDRGLSTTGV